MRSQAGHNLAIIELSGRKHLQVEVACESHECAKRFCRQFGGRVEKLPRDWLERFSREQKRNPLKVGKRLIIANVEGSSAKRGGLSGSCRTGAIRKSLFLLIPAGVAFGTGQHVTTAMSVRFLEQITRVMKPGWSLIDLGTGSGILALSAKRFGAKRVAAIDVDPMAISTARENAKLNEIENIDFRVADVRRWKTARKGDIIIANLFSELLIEILPRLRTNLKPGGQLILSGVLRSQERALLRALRANQLAIVEVRRRGKWIAVLAQL